jgi:hypothetical protein
MDVRISVFGGSQSTPGDRYIRMLHLEILFHRRHTLLNGGYIGTMDLVSWCSRSWWAVIGVTCDQIEAWRPRRGKLVGN